jgi:hypothetical protein
MGARFHLGHLRPSFLVNTHLYLRSHSFAQPNCSELNNDIHRQYLCLYEVQIYSIVFQAGDEFTKEVGKAFKDLTHFLMLLVTLVLIMYFSDFSVEYVVGISVGFAFTMARTISYTLVCSVAEMKFQQFQPSVLVFSIVYSGKECTI